MGINMEERLSDNSRFERKYVIDKNKSWLFRGMLKEKNFFKTFKTRKVNSIYFDTIDFKYFKENIEGVGQRIKPRLRWYEYSKNEKKHINIVLEIKSKNGFVGTKKQFNFGKFKNLEDLSVNIKKYNFTNKISKIVQQQVFPILITSYNREYFLDENKILRSTIDTELKVIPMSNLKFELPIFKEILEIKYNTIYDNEYRRMISGPKFRFRFQKFSKYVAGLLYLKKNGLI